MRAHLESIFRAGVEACRPERVLVPHLPPPPRGRVFLLAAGKAAASMAQVAERHYAGPLSGVAVVPHGATGELERVALLHAGHPIPDEASIHAAEILLGLAEEAEADDLLLVLLSGGASSLACMPGDGLSLAEKQALTTALLHSGAAIGEINCVRRHLSGIKGGRLGLAARPAPVVTLAIADVAGDRPEDIGSGPTVADPTTIANARWILERHRIPAPPSGWTETPTDIICEFQVVARPADAIQAAANEARRLGYQPILLGECSGEARDLGRLHADQAREAAPGTALISGGEVNVQVTGGGSGGRNHEYALAAAIRLSGRADICGLAADSDGIDGTSEAAGAYFDGTTFSRSDRDPTEALVESDSGGFFAELGDQFVTGPTDTNVNDLRIILVAP